MSLESEFTVNLFRGPSSVKELLSSLKFESLLETQVNGEPARERIVHLYNMFPLRERYSIEVYFERANEIIVSLFGNEKTQVKQDAIASTPLVL